MEGYELTIDDENALTIPEKVLKELKWNTGDALLLEADGDQIILK